MTDAGGEGDIGGGCAVTVAAAAADVAGSQLGQAGGGGTGAQAVVVGDPAAIAAAAAVAAAAAAADAVSDGFAWLQAEAEKESPKVDVVKLRGFADSVRVLLVDCPVRLACACNYSLLKTVSQHNSAAGACNRSLSRHGNSNNFNNRANGAGQSSR